MEDEGEGNVDSIATRPTRAEPLPGFKAVKKVRGKFMYEETERPSNESVSLSSVCQLRAKKIEVQILETNTLP